MVFLVGVLGKYAKIFPKNVLDSARKKVGELDEIVGVMENKKV
jgi:hypothetical protein